MIGLLKKKKTLSTTSPLPPVFARKEHTTKECQHPCWWLYHQLAKHNRPFTEQNRMLRRKRKRNQKCPEATRELELKCPFTFLTFFAWLPLTSDVIQKEEFLGQENNVCTPGLTFWGTTVDKVPRYWCILLGYTHTLKAWHFIATLQQKARNSAHKGVGWGDSQS